MPDRHFDFAIVGQGLAGTSLAWALHWLGRRVLLIDREEQNTASRVAAGLMTPITGQRFVLTPEWNEYRAVAVRFYARIESDLGARIFRGQPMLRLFANADEREMFQSKSANEYPDVVAPNPPIDAALYDAPDGGFEMREGGRLNVTAYLGRSREFFAQQGGYFRDDLDAASGVELSSGVVNLPAYGITAGRLIFCQGFAGRDNPWFAGIPFDSTQGDILTIRVHGLAEERVVHRGIWLAPEGDGVFRVGATHRREPLDGRPTAAGREELCERLGSLLLRQFEVIDHRAAVRPILLGRRPLLGFHPQHPQLGYFNGLGSKGTLSAPFLAAHFADVLTGGVHLKSEFDLNRKWDLRTCRG